MTNKESIEQIFQWSKISSSQSQKMDLKMSSAPRDKTCNNSLFSFYNQSYDNPFKQNESKMQESKRFTSIQSRSQANTDKKLCSKIKPSMTWYENQGEVNNKENAVQNLVFP